jgi:hypothetical protein
MAKYRALFENKVLKSVNATKEDIPANDTFLEETTGSVIWAIIEAASDEEAQQKAERLETELQTGQNKETLRDKENSTG